MGMWQMINTGQHGAKHFSVRGNAPDCNAAKTDPVIAALPADETGACPVAPNPVIAERHFECRIHGFRT